MKKIVLVFAALMCFPNVADAQIKIEGDKNATVGYMLKIKLSQLNVDDPQIKCFPDNPDWLATKDFAGTAWIIYVPGKKTVASGEKSKLVTFVVAGGKGGKTYLETHEVTVTPEDAVPPDPPTPDEVTKTQLYKDLYAAYKVSPSAPSKVQLIKVYTVFIENIQADKYKTYKEANTALADVTPQFVGTNLKAVRDAVADYLVASVGTSGLSYNKAKLAEAVEKVIVVLKKIPD